MSASALLLGLALFGGHASAAPNTPGAVQKQNLQHIQGEVKRLEGSIQSAKQAEASLTGELGRLEKLLKLQALEIELSAMELEKLEAHVQEMNLRKDSLHGSIEIRKKRLRMALSLLPTLETRSPIARLTESDGAALHQYRELVKKMLESDKGEILSLRKVLDEVQALNAQLAEQQERQLAHNEDLKEKQAVLELNQKLKKELLTKTRAEQGERLRSYQTAKAAEGELESVLSRFNLAAEVKRQREEESAAAAAGAEKPALPLRRAGSGFASRKGGLPQPIDGKIVTSFGRRYDAKASLYTFHKGVDIQANSPGGVVAAVSPGKVVFAGKIGGYGQLLILDHGDQYYSLVGQLGEALKGEGDEVREGESIGRAALDGTPVYFEIRQRHVAVNPVPWFVQGGRAPSRVN
jgi:septal ring factor EnvC (AmiA/AmiB activator)